MRLQFSDPEALRAATRVIGEAVEDDANLVLQVPSDSSVASIRTLVDLLDDARIEVEEFSTHGPDLNDVFFAVTGHPADEEVGAS